MGPKEGEEKFCLFCMVQNQFLKNILSDMNWLMLLLILGVILIVVYLVIKSLGVDLIDSIVDFFDELDD